MENIKIENGSFINPQTGKRLKVGSRKAKELLKDLDRCLGYPRQQRHFQPTQYQLDVQNYVETILYPYSDVRGLLLYWGLGSGKSCGADLAINSYHRLFPERKVHIWTSGSLRTNFIEQYCSVCGDYPLSSWFEIHTYNQSNVKSVLDKINMNNSLIVVDEAHHLWHGKANESEQYSFLYDAILNTVNSRFIFLTGTPLLSNTDELFYLFQLVYPKCKWNLKEFNERFFSKRMTDEERMEWFMLFVFPYFPVQRGEYPDSREVFVDVPFKTQEHDDYYTHIRKSEIERSKIRPSASLRMRDPLKYKEQMTSWYLAYSMTQSRQSSNLFYPSDIREKYQSGQLINDDVYQEILNPVGWITKDTLLEVPELSEKLDTILKTIMSSTGKQVIYSYFVTNSGIRFISSILTLMRIPHLVFDGSLDDSQREERLRLFNENNNAYGQKYRVLLITNAASEGITLLGVRGLHILEQSIQEWQIDQIKGRVVRLNSHIQLPQQDRNVIIYRYMIKPEKKDLSSDYASYAIGVQNKLAVQPFLDMMKMSPFVEFYGLRTSPNVFRMRGYVYDIFDERIV